MLKGKVADIPYSFSKFDQLGEKIRYQDQLGVLTAQLDDKVEVTLENGEKIIRPRRDVVGDVLIDTRMKACPMCKSKDVKPVMQEGEQDVQQCMSCSSRFKNQNQLNTGGI